MIVRSRAPLRLGLAGGGTDVSPYVDKFGGFVLNATIDRYAWTTLQDADTITFSASDLDVTENISLSSPIEIKNPLILHKAVYKVMMDRYNKGKYIPLNVCTTCEAPMGSGLGASSTIVVSMVAAYARYFGLFLDYYEIASLAVYIERVVCGLQGGLQDQYAATFGGINFMEFNGRDNVLINPLRLKRSFLNELEASLLLYFTGVSRESAKIIKTQSNNVLHNKVEALQAMHQLKQDAYDMKSCLLKGDFSSLVEIIHSSWENKKASSTSVSTQQIEQIFTIAFENGALAGKVSGAGGGGFMWFFVPPELKLNLARALRKFGGLTSECHFTSKGTEAWKVTHLCQS